MDQKTIIIGFLAILCVVAVLAVADSVSAIQGFSGNSSVSNSTAGATDTATITATVKATAKATTVAATKATTKATATPTTAKTTAKATVAATTKATTKATATPTATPVSYTSTQIYQHLTDIAFGPENTEITKVETSPEKITIAGSYTDADLSDLKAFKEKFNTGLSTTTQLSEPTVGTNGNIVLHFMPGKSIDSIATDTDNPMIINYGDDGIICSIYSTTHSYATDTNNAYINSDLAGDEREHYLLRGLLYYLGFMGESGKYSDSMFYYQPNANSELSTIDEKAVQLMYGSKITNGMTLSKIKSFY